jgi:hypothetical protein
MIHGWAPKRPSEYGQGVEPDPGERGYKIAAHDITDIFLSRIPLPSKFKALTENIKET